MLVSRAFPKSTGLVVLPNYFCPNPRYSYECPAFCANEIFQNQNSIIQSKIAGVIKAFQSYIESMNLKISEAQSPDFSSHLEMNGANSDMRLRRRLKTEWCLCGTLGKLVSTLSLGLEPKRHKEALFPKKQWCFFFFLSGFLRIVK